MRYDSASFLFHCLIIFNCVGMTHFIYPFITWWVFGLFLHFGYHEQCHYKHLRTRFCGYIISLGIYLGYISLVCLRICGKESTCNAGAAGDMGSVSGWGRYPLEEGMATHSSILAWSIPMDRGAWQATIHRVSKSRTWPKQLNTHIDHIVIPHLTFWRNAKLYPQISVPIYIPTSNAWKFWFFFFTIFVNTCYYLFFFDYCHPTGCEMIAHYDCSLFLSLNLFPWLSFVFDPFSSLSV